MSVYIPPSTSISPVQIWETEVLIANTSIPIYQWQIDLAAYGQLGRAHIRSTFSMMKTQGINFAAISSNQPYAPVTILLNGQTVFTGTYLHGNFQADTDEIEIFCRDYAGQLLDTKRSLADLNYTNVTVSQLVTNIANKYGYGTNINISNNPLVGTIAAEGQSIMAARPQPLWNLLVYLSKQIGATIYVDFNKNIVLQDSVIAFTNPVPPLAPSISQQLANPGLAQQVLNPTQNIYTWEPTPTTFASNPGTQPIEKLRFLHQPCRNQNFAVVVTSHHQPTGTTGTQTIVVAGETIDLGNGSSVKNGVYTGTGGVAIHGALAKAGLNIPIVYIRAEGKTPDQVQSLAQAVANDIASRLIVVNMTIDGNTSLQPLQTLQISEAVAGSLLGFASRTFYITGVTHHLSVPQSDNVETTGFQTVLKALTLPPSGGVLSGDQIESLGATE